MRVLEVGTVLMVPYAGQILGDLGADVVKVESPVGDPGRLIGPSPIEDLSGVALNLNRNKRSVVLDLGERHARSSLHRLIRTCDVLITNLRPSALERFELTYERVRGERPDIIYCQSHGHRAGSPGADEPAYDDVIQAAAGIACLSEEAGGEASLLPTVLVDKVCGLTIVQSVLAALYHRSVTGVGQAIDVPMYDVAVAFNLVEHLAGATTRPPLAEPGYARVLTPHRRPFRTSDGTVVMLPYSAKDWRRLWRALDRNEIADQLKGLSEAEVKARAAEMYKLLADAVADRSTDECLDLCHRLGLAGSRVASLSEVVRDGIEVYGTLEMAEHPTAGSYTRIRPPVNYSVTPAAIFRDAPSLGVHTREVLNEVDLGAHEVEGGDQD